MANDGIGGNYVESILLFVLLFVSLPGWQLPAYAWIFLVLYGSGLPTKKER
jgi:hypothetical protein